MEVGLDEIIETMETLLVEYDQQESQLDTMQWILSYLKYGYNSLRHQLSSAECAASELIMSAEGLDEGLDEHIEQSSIEDINECLEQSEASLDALEPIVHPCGEGEWRLVVNDKYSNPTADDCPNGWEQFVESITTRRFCARRQSDDEPCQSAFFSVSGGEYSKVCGTIVAYGHAIQAAFAFNENDIDNVHVNGISVTHGNPRQHIWTLAIGVVESATGIGPFVIGVCPCRPDFVASIPPFIGDDYFCESGLNGEDLITIIAQLANMPYYLDDPLWDGRQCFGDCCRGSPFVKTLANGPTTDPLEIRICNLEFGIMGNIVVEEIKIYVQ